MSSIGTSRVWIGWSILILSFLLFVAPARGQGPADLTGTVADVRDGAPLIGATVVLRDASSAEVVEGTTTDVDGNFEFANIEPGEYAVDVRFIGYKERTLSLTIEAGDSRDLDVELELETESLETVVVSASRTGEKILDAPASISVLEPEQIRRSITTSSVEALQSTPGVDMAQTGIDRREVATRGFNEAYSSSIHVLTDYREASVPSLGVNAYNAMPSIPIDLRRVEVVRGPGSALYGPGVDSGVIHFFTKDPFQDPGTSVSLTGGSRSFFNGQIRQAGVLGETLGYKITAQYSRADEWGLDPNDPKDEAELNRYRIYQDPNDPDLQGRNFVEADFDGDGETEAQLRREDLFRKYNVNGLLAYRLGSDTELTLNGGYSSITGAFQSGVGTLQTNDFGYSYAQLRLESGDLFAQAYLNQNHSDDGYAYGDGRTTIDRGLQWNGQIQYTFAFQSLSTDVITGADLDLTRPRTDGTVLGRNEGNDSINEYGTYVQTTTDLSSSLALTLAGRADYNNVVEQLQFSPRAALVYNVTSDHSIRTTYNQAFSSPGVNSLFLDVTAQRQSLGNGKELVFQGLGAADEFTFNQFENDGTVRFSLPVDPFFKSQYSIDALPVAPMYAAVADRALEGSGQDVGFTSEVVSQLPSALNEQQRNALAVLFGATAQEAAAQNFLAADQHQTDAAELGLPDDSENEFRSVNGPVNVDPLKQTTTQSFEIGYKGTFADRVRINLDGYYEQKENFVGPLRVESPLAYLQGRALTQDTRNALTQSFDNLEGTASLLLGQLEDTGISRDSAATLLGGIVGGGLDGTPTAVVQPDQDILPGNNPNQVGGFLTYRNFGEVQYWGIDASVEIDLTDTFTTFGNVSFVSDDFFDNEELGESEDALNLALNAPTLKVKGGFDYGLPGGFSVGATTQYVDGFPVRSGPYVGNVESYTLLDVRAAYNIPAVPGLNVAFTGKNILNNEHREFVGAPEIGRMLMGRLTYELP